jgi:NAD(P)-dependent dehydrogenase (short-subunit alcohol dehydrogenase family)
LSKLSKANAGRTYIVTGGGAGIGKAACEHLAGEGAFVVAVDRNFDTVQVTAAGSPCRIFPLQGDVTKLADMEAAVASAFDRFGRLDGAFNNAGIGPAELGAKGVLTAEFSNEQWSKLIEVNLTGTWIAMKAQLPRLGAGASIVNNASIAGLAGIAGSAAYVASKHGVIGLTKTAALEYAKSGIRINAVCPGYTETAMTPFNNMLAASIPAERLGQPHEIAALVSWLLGSEAGYVTGAAINVDGGFLAR